MNLIKFIITGLLVTLAGEFQINILVQHQPLGKYLMVFVVYRILLSIFYTLGKFLDKKFTSNKSDLLYYFIAGFTGLLIEWFLIGNSIYQNPSANQAGMFAWWAAVFLVPRIFTKLPDPATQIVKKRIYAVLIPYSIISTVFVAQQVAVPEIHRIAATALTMIFGFILLNYFLVNYLITQNPHLQKRLKYFYKFLVIVSLAQLFLIK
jgi:hypothetical protein